MLSTAQNRLDPSDFDRKTLESLVATLARPGHVSLLDQEGKRTEIPDAFYRHLVRILGVVNTGRAVIMIPEDETFTTQAAANFIGISRQYLVNLLEKGHIPFHTVGTHRRIKFKDLLEYQKHRDASRRKALDELASKVASADLYFPKEDQSSE
ncbi:MAG: excisionase family DNA-binding protein [Verrucomicrobiota bacterium]|nr:excisionase family DNA-binding protein [Verrucomicrobiota bacterium]